MSTPDPLAQSGHSDAMDIDQSKKRDADSLFVHEDEEDEVGHNSKRQKQDLDSAYASQSQGGTPEQDHDSTSETQPQAEMVDDSTRKDDMSDTQSQADTSPRKTSSRKKSSTIIVVNGKVPGLKQWVGDRRPCLAVYHPSFKQSEKAIIRACNRFIQQYDLLKDKGYFNAEIEHIVVRRLSRWRSPEPSYPTVKPVVLLGAAGAGKSSGLNCYLDTTAAAVESDSGARGTKTVHEYSMACYDQTSKYRVIARYAPQSQIKLDVEKHCSAVFNYRKRESGQFEADEEVDLKKQHDTAMDFFNTLLGDREDFDVDSDETDYFDDNCGEEAADLAPELCEYVEKLLESKGILAPNMTQTLDAQNEEELNSIFTALSGPSGPNSDTAGHISTWPLISKIEIHLQNDLLDDGVTIADAPGVTDTNHTVVQKTKDYLKYAGTIFVYTTPTRVKNNPDLDENLIECIRLGKMQSTYLIVTNIDRKTSFKQIDLPNLRAEDRAQLKDAEDRLQTLKKEVNHLEEVKEPESKGDLKVYKAFEARIRNVELDIKKAENNIQQVAVEIRNRDIDRMAKNKFRELSGKRTAPDLKVIFTSNSQYQEHLAGYDQKDPPVLELLATGIPKVQEVLYRVPAIGKVHTLGRINDAHLPGVFNGIIGTLTKSPLERKSEVSILMKTHLGDDGPILARVLDELKASFRERIIGSFNRNTGKWVAALDGKLQEWKSYKAMTFTAFCRRKGVWKAAKNAPLSNWNYEIQEVYRVSLNGAFNLLDDDINDIESGLITSINTLFQELVRKLEACEALQGVDMRDFFEEVNGLGNTLGEAMVECFQDLKSTINEIRNTATLPSEHTCILSIMESTYAKCAALCLATTAPAASTVPSTTTGPPPSSGLSTSTGKAVKPKTKKKGGVHAVRVEELRKKLIGDGGVTGVYEAVLQELRARFRGLVQEYEGRLNANLAYGSNSVLKAFDSRFQTADTKKEQYSEAAETLKNEAKLALEGIEEAKALLEEAVAYETANAASA